MTRAWNKAIAALDGTRWSWGWAFLGTAVVLLIIAAMAGGEA